MILRLTPAFLLAVATAFSANPASPPIPASERTLRAHVAFLADDLLEGRAAGTRGHELAIAYVVAQYSRLGLEPAGTDGFLQPMALRESKLDLEAGRLDQG